MKQRVAWVLTVGMGCVAWIGGCQSSSDSDPDPDPDPGRLLTRVDVEPAGAHCAGGGSAIRAGLDRNRNGALDDDEIERTEYVCAESGELWPGDFAGSDWTDPAKVAVLQHVRVVLGSLTVASQGAVTLPALELVGGNLSVTAGGVAVVLPALRSVGGVASIETSGDVAPSLPALDHVTSDLTIGGRGGAGGLVAAPNLREVGGRLVIAATAAGELTLPGLQTIRGNLQLQGALTGLHLDHLASILGSIDLTPGTALSVALPSLTSIGGDVQSITSQLTSLELPVLEALTGTLSLQNLSALTQVAMPRASEIGNLFITQVNALTKVDIGVHFVNGTFYVSDAPALATLPMPSLRAVGADFVVQLTGIQELAFPLLQFSRSCLIVAANPALRSLALPALTDIPCLSIYDSPPLSSVIAPKVERLDALSINGTSATHTVDFRALETVRLWVDIRGASLADLSGLGALTEVGQLHLEKIDQLRDLAELSSIRRMSALELISNPMLTSLAGLDQVTQIPDRLMVQDNRALASLAGLQNVTSVGSFLFSGDAALTELALSDLLSVDGPLRIIGMASLADLIGLDTLKSVRGDILLDDNAVLPAKEINRFLARFILGHN